MLTNIDQLEKELETLNTREVRKTRILFENLICLFTEETQ